MELSVDTREAGDGGAVSILRLAGALDGKNFQEVIGRVQALYAAGTRRLLIDLSDVTFLSSAGLVALHSAALILRGQGAPDLEEGWNVFHTIGNEVDAASAPEASLRLLQPQPRVARALDMSGFSRLIPTYGDEDEAIASFDA